MQDDRREAIHNPPQGKATQGAEQHGFQPSKKEETSNKQSKNKNITYQKGRIGKWVHAEHKLPLFCFSTGTEASPVLAAVRHNIGILVKVLYRYITVKSNSLE